MGDKAKPLAAYRPTALLFSEWTAGESSFVLHERGSEAAGFGHHFDAHRLSDCVALIGAVAASIGVEVTAHFERVTALHALKTPRSMDVTGHTRK